MILKSVLKWYKSDPFLLYIINKLSTEVVIIYVDYTLVIVDKMDVFDKLEYTNKWYTTQEMVQLE